MSIQKIVCNWAIIIFVCLSSAGCKSAIEGHALPANAEIAFISWHEMNIDLYKITRSGSSGLTNTPQHESYPVWSSDGSQIAFLSNQNGERHLEVMDADGSNRRVLAKSILARDEPPAWAFDSQMIAFACSFEQRSTICLASVTGNWMQPMPGDWASIGSIQWAPADPAVLFHANSGNSKDIFIYITYTGEIRNLTNRAGHDFSPTWSPDGRKIAFISTRNAKTGLYTMNIDGTNPHLLLSTNIKRRPCLVPGRKPNSIQPGNRTKPPLCF